MKKFALFLATTIAMVSCGTQSRIPQYSITLSSVESRADNNVVDAITSVPVDGILQYVYEDGYMRILWFVDRTSFHFSLENKTDRSIRIDWDNIVYVDYDGEAGRVVHSGIKYNERNSEQAPSIVPRGTRITDVLLPADNVEWNMGMTGWEWQEKPLLKGLVWKPVDEVNRNPYMDYTGATMKIVMPLEIGGSIREYTFTFIAKRHNPNT